MCIIAPVTIPAVAFLVLIAKDSFVFAVDFDVLVEAVLFLLAVTFLEVFALEFFIG